MKGSITDIDLGNAKYFVILVENAGSADIVVIIFQFALFCARETKAF